MKRPLAWRRSAVALTLSLLALLPAGVVAATGGPGGSGRSGRAVVRADDPGDLDDDGTGTAGEVPDDSDESDVQVPLLAAPNPAPRPMAVVSTGTVRLTFTRRRQVDARALRAAINVNDSRVTLGDLLTTPPLRLAHHRCKVARQPGGVLRGVQRLRDWYCLTKKNSETKAWTPQGVSGTYDAHQDGLVDGRRAFAFSWHQGGVGKSGAGSRLSFLDPTTSLYKHVLLVEIYRNASGNLSYRDLRSHAGGIVWYRHWMFVADPSVGLEVFDMDNILNLGGSPVGNTTDKKLIGRHGNRYYGHGYDFVLPEIGVWKRAAKNARYDYVGLDRSVTDSTGTVRPQALTGEWCRPPGGTGEPCRTPGVGRVFRWRMSRLTTFSGTVKPLRAFRQPTPYTQGGVSWNSCYSFDDGDGGNAFLIAASPGRTPKSYRGASGLQDLYLRRGTTFELWTVTEHPGWGNRVLYGVNRPGCPTT